MGSSVVTRLTGGCRASVVRGPCIIRACVGPRFPVAAQDYQSSVRDHGAAVAVPDQSLVLMDHRHSI